MRTGKSARWIVAAALALLAGIFTLQAVSAQVRPPTPTIYSGNAIVAGQPAENGLPVHAQIRDYRSEPVVVEDGRFEALVVQPPNDSYNKGVVTFHIEGIKAAEFDVYILGGLPRIESSFDLSFPALPQPTPTSTSLPPAPTPTPTVALPSAYSGQIIIAGAPVPRDAVLVARIGEYESVPAIIRDGAYSSLVLDPRDIEALGAKVEFFMNGFRSSVVSSYASGKSIRDFDLIFVGIPTPTITPTPTNTPPPPTPTPTPTLTPTPTPSPSPLPTATPTAMPPTATPTSTPTAVPPTPTPTPTAAATAVPASATPTATPAPPSPTAVPPTATPRVTTLEPPAGIPKPPESVVDSGAGGGLCGSTSGVTTPMAGAGNLLALFGPLGLLIVRRRARRS